MISRFFLLCLIPASSLFAETDPPLVVPPPRPPWVAPVPERGKWMVKIADPAAGPQTDAQGNPIPLSGVNRRPSEIESLTWNAVKRDIFRYTDGTSSTVFYYVGCALVEGQSSKGQPAPVLVQQLPGTDFTTLRSGGWLGMDWLDQKYYVEPRPYQKMLAPKDARPEVCYFFRKPEGSNPGSEGWLPEMQAWIRVADLQPVAIKIGSKTFEFQRLPDPSEPPPMTAEQAAKLLDLKDQNARMEKLAERNKRILERREFKRKQNAAKENTPGS